jgi:hypothetical protein
MHKHKYFVIIFRSNFLKIKNSDLKNSKQLIFLSHRIFIGKINEYDKSNLKVI